MTLSIWRYSHLALAISSSLFLLLASLTGIILAFEPITNRLQYSHTKELSEISIAECVTALQNNGQEIISLEVNKSDAVIASVIDKDGNDSTIYINPKTAQKLGVIQDKNPIFQFATTLHRSLFLKTIGRFFIGLTAFFLFLISLTGIVLVAKKQGGIRNFFQPIVKESFNPYYHTILGKWLLISMLIISITGGYLSLERFDVISSPKSSSLSKNIDFKEEKRLPLADFPIFKNTLLSQLHKLEFPFSEFPEDYFLLELKNKELIINQFNGEVLAERKFPIVAMLSYYATILHTGSGSIIWSLVLMLSAIGILFFMYSGFSISWQRKSSKIKNPYSLKECSHLILVGSEGGSTWHFANALHLELIRLGKKCYLTQMNAYKPSESLQHLIIFTSTYGQGEAPDNARKFEELLQKNPPIKSFVFSVVGFGSMSYPDFCKFAFHTDMILQKYTKGERLKEVFTINNQSVEAFHHWILEWAKIQNLSNIQLPKVYFNQKKKKQYAFEVMENTAEQDMDNFTFLLKLKIQQRVTFQSGDLLCITSDLDGRERLYSIGKWNNNSLVISVKRHLEGVVSNQLFKLKKGEILQASIVKNKRFHIPNKVPSALLIATGTGIGPYLGMIQENNNKKPIEIYWGGRTQSDFKLYRNILKNQQQQGKLQQVHLAYSRESQAKNYVQHLLKKDSDKVSKLLKNRGVIMICGSVQMQKSVLETLEIICNEEIGRPLNYYENKGQILMDCY